jgi:hypothetical protein
MRRKAFSFGILLLVMIACKGTSLPLAGISTPVSGKATDSGNQPSSIPSEVSIATVTSTPSQPVYDPAQLGDLSKLDSYVVASRETIRNAADPEGGKGQRDTQASLTVINVPRQAHHILTYTNSNIAGQDDETRSQDRYWANGAVYRKADVYSYPAEWLVNAEEDNLFYLDGFTSRLSNIRSARFVGQEDYQGILANHFVFDQMDWVSDPNQYPQQIESVQGNIYLTQDGNYPLHLDYRLSADIWWERNVDTSLGILDVTYDLSSINQVTGIDLPKDIPLQVKLDVGVPLPPGTKLSFVSVNLDPLPYQYSYHYDYDSDLSADEIIAFYQALQPANGWMLDYIYRPPDTPDYVCVTLKSNDQFLGVEIYFPEPSDVMIWFNYPPLSFEPEISCGFH